MSGTTSTAGTLSTGLSASNCTVLSAIVTSSDYPNGIYADVVIASNTFWLVVKNHASQAVTNKTITCYIYYVNF